MGENRLDIQLIIDKEGNVIEMGITTNILNYCSYVQEGIDSPMSIDEAIEEITDELNNYRK